MKPLIALIATASLPFAAQAQGQTMAQETRSAATAAMSSSSSSSSSSTCSISSNGGFSSLDYSWGASNSSSSASAMGRHKSDGWNLSTGRPGIADEGLRLAWTPSSSGGAPTVVAHAINTKGTGGTNGRQVSSATACDTAPTRADTESPADLACRINPGRSVTIFNPPPPPMLDKASFQDFHFTISSHRSAGAGPGAGPHVKSIVCSGPDGSPTSVSMLLLPAVQK